MFLLCQLKYLFCSFSSQSSSGNQAAYLDQQTRTAREQFYQAWPSSSCSGHWPSTRLNCPLDLWLTPQAPFDFGNQQDQWRLKKLCLFHEEIHDMVISREQLNHKKGLVEMSPMLILCLSYSKTHYIIWGFQGRFLSGDHQK